MSQNLSGVVFSVPALTPAAYRLIGMDPPNRPFDAPKLTPAAEHLLALKEFSERRDIPPRGKPIPKQELKTFVRSVVPEYKSYVYLPMGFDDGVSHGNRYL